MAGWPPKKNAAFTWYFFIRDADGDPVAGAAALDVEYSIDGGVFTDVAGTEVDEGEGLYSCPIAAGEMNGDVIALICKTSTAGAKTAAQVIYTSTRQLDDLAYPATSGRSIQVETDGMIHADLKEWLAAAPNALIAGRVDSNVQAMANAVIAAATFAAGAIDSAALAQSAADKIIQAVSGTADAGSTATTIVDAERTEATTDYWQHSVIVMTGGANVGQARRVTAFNATSDTITVAPAFKSAVGAGDTYIILRTAVADGLRPITEGNEIVDVAADGDVGADVQTWLDATVSALIAGRVDADAQVVSDKTGYTLTAAERANIVDEVWDELQSGHLTAGTFGRFLDSQLATIQADTDDIQARLPAALVGGRIDASVGAMAANVLTAAAIAADAITAAKIATNAIGGDEFAQAAADKVFGSGGATLAELAQAIPPATPRPDQALMLLYMALRNKLDVDANNKEIHNDAGTVIAKKPLTDDGTTYSEAEMVAGP